MDCFTRRPGKGTALPTGAAFTALTLLATVLAAADNGHSLEHHSVAMRDGVELATDVYLPESTDGPVPILLVRSVYGRAAGEALANRFAPMGIGVAIQDTRGRGDSGGEDRAFADDGWGERQDGVDTVAWLLDQEWCNGAVGSWGPSALGYTQLLMAAAGAPVAAQSMHVAPPALHGHLSYQGGVWRKEPVEAWFAMQNNLPVMETWKAETACGPFWDAYNTIDRPGDVTAAGIHLGGWFDLFSQGTLDVFRARQHEGGEGARGQQFLIMGPWAHGFGAPTGELAFPGGAFDLDAFENRFFREYLLGEDAGMDAEPRVRYYTMGSTLRDGAPGNAWREAESWPPFPLVDEAYYLGADGGLWSSVDAAENGALTYTFDPENPVPVHGGANLTIPSGPKDQREVSRRGDVLRFETPPLDAPMEVTGPVAVRLFVSSDRPDTDFTAKLIDVYPDGREMLLLDSIQRAKFRDHCEEPSLLTPGETAEVLIDLWSISYIFDEGHRIAVHVSSSNYPRFEVNPNTGADFPGENGMEPAENTVHMGADSPSALIVSRPREGAAP